MEQYLTAGDKPCKDITATKEYLFVKGSDSLYYIIDDRGEERGYDKAYFTSAPYYKPEPNPVEPIGWKVGDRFKDIDDTATIISVDGSKTMIVGVPRYHGDTPTEWKTETVNRFIADGTWVIQPAEQPKWTKGQRFRVVQEGIGGTDAFKGGVVAFQEHVNSHYDFTCSKGHGWIIGTQVIPWVDEVPETKESEPTDTRIPFDIELWKTGKYDAVYRDGGKVKGITIISNATKNPIISVDQSGDTITHGIDGGFFGLNESPLDLFLTHKAYVEYANVEIRNCVHYSEISAERCKRDTDLGMVRITTINGVKTTELIKTY